MSKNSNTGSTTFQIEGFTERINSITIKGYVEKETTEESREKKWWNKTTLGIGAIGASLSIIGTIWWIQNKTLVSK